MYISRSHRQIAFIAVLFAFCLIGCTKQQSPHSTGGGRVGLRELKFDLDGPGGFSQDANQNAGAISFDGGKVVLENSRVLLGDKEIAKIPDNAKVIFVRYAAGTLTVTSDGENAYEQKLK
jgi:hypothetical protein